MTTPYLTNDNYRSFNALSQSDLRRYVQYDKFGTRTTNYLGYKYQRPRKEGTDAMLVGTIVDGHFTEGMKVSFPSEKEMWILSGYETVKVPIQKINEECELMFDENGDPIPELNTKGEVIFREDEKPVYEIYDIPDRRSSKAERPQISRSMADEIREMIEALEQVPEIMEVVNRSETQLILSDDTLLELPIKGKIDLMDTTAKHLIDLKTSGTSIASFEKDFIFKWTISVYHGYVRQLAFYRLLARQNNYEVNGCQILFCGMNTMGNAEIKVYNIPESIMSIAENLLISDISDLAKAIKEDDVSTYFPELTQPTDDTNETPNFD